MVQLLGIRQVLASTERHPLACIHAQCWVQDAEQIIEDVGELAQLLQLDPKSTQRLVSDHPRYIVVTHDTAAELTQCHL